jgi:hypothetical protein
MSSLAHQAQAIADAYLPTLSLRHYLSGIQGGRPTKLTADLIEQVITELELAPLGRDALCDLIGITPQTRRNWLKAGEADYEEGKPSLEARFFDVLKRAYAYWQRELLQRVLRGKQDWVAYMTTLERLWPELYGRNRPDFTAQVAVQIGVTVEQVKVGIMVSPQTFAPHSLLEDSAKLLTGNTFDITSSPIISNYVNQPSAVPMLAGESDRLIPAGESSGGPQPGVARTGGQRRPTQRKGRLPKTRKKAVQVLVQDASTER